MGLVPECGAGGRSGCEFAVGDDPDEAVAELTRDGGSVGEDGPEQAGRSSLRRGGIAEQGHPCGLDERSHRVERGPRPRPRPEGEACCTACEPGPESSGGGGAQPVGDDRPSERATPEGGPRVLVALPEVPVAGSRDRRPEHLHSGEVRSPSLHPKARRGREGRTGEPRGPRSGSGSLRSSSRSRRTS